MRIAGTPCEYLRASPLERGHERRHGQNGRGISHAARAKAAVHCQATCLQLPGRAVLVGRLHRSVT